MFSIRDIIKRDLATYYAGEPPKRISRLPAFSTFAIISLIFTAIVVEPSNDFLAGAISSEAILAGFSFNVLFYLTTNRLVPPAKWVSLEHELRFDRLKHLADEIFDNICYFNLLAVASIVFGLVLLLSGSNKTAEFFAKTALIISNKQYTTAIVQHLPTASQFILKLVLLILLFSLFESFYSFIRIVSRLRFYFQMQKTMVDDNLKD